MIEIKETMLQMQNPDSFYPWLEIMLEDVIYAEGHFVDRQSQNEATYKIQVERLNKLKKQIIQGQKLLELISQSSKKRNDKLSITEICISDEDLERMELDLTF